MKYAPLFVMGALLLGQLYYASTGWATEKNQYHKICLERYGYDISAPLDVRMNFKHFNLAAACVTDFRNRDWTAQLKRMRRFLDQNPHYRIPGGSHGHIDPCWGKNTTMSLKHGRSCHG